MSRKVDIDSLDADDALYLRDRPNLVREAELQGVTDIRERIADALRPDPEPEVVPASEDPDEVARVTNYEALNLTDLRDLAKSRNLPADGGKRKLISTLQAGDVSTGHTATVSREAEGAVEAVSGSGDDEDESA